MKGFMMEKNIYVFFLYEDHYPRQQIFKEFGNDNYYGRDHFLLWHSIYRENNQIILEMVMPKKVTFIICDKNKKVLFTSSNSKPVTNFPLLRYRCLQEWSLIKENYNIISENGFAIQLHEKKISTLSKWLLSLKKEYETTNKLSIYNDNLWLTKFESLTNEPEVLHSFNYCGTQIHIYRLQYQHTVCKRRWYEYYAGKEHVGILLLP